MEIPEAAINAAVATSSRAPLRNAEQAESYRKRVTEVIQAALPALREQWEQELLEEEAFDAAANAQEASKMGGRFALRDAFKAAFRVASENRAGSEKRDIERYKPGPGDEKDVARGEALAKEHGWD